MPWLSLVVETDAEHAEMLSDTLLELGALSVDLLDADAGTPDEQAIFGEPGETPPRHGAVEPSGAGGAAGRLFPQSAGFASNVSQPPPGMWQHNRISALFDSDQDVTAILRDAAASIGLKQTPEHRIETLADNDWVRHTQSQFGPIPISPRLWIVPSWHTPGDPDAINIALDPGLAFGTGSHPTTRLCLRWLDDHLQGGESVLDYGCGSGILAIAALKLGAARAVGIDVDSQAIQASRENAAANQVESAQFYLPDDAPRYSYDLVVANILTNPLRMLAPLLANATRQGGQIVLSGILGEQAQDVMKIYQQWFDLNAPIFEDGWACLSGRKR